jgi:hypothetical protein
MSASDTGGGASRRHRRDGAVLVVGVVALLTYALHGFDGYLTRDLGIYAYAGQQFAEGVPPYVSVLNRAGPLAQMLPGVGVLAAHHLGLGDVVGARLLFLLFAVACVCLLYRLARDVFSSRAAGLAAAAAFLSFEGFVRYASGGPREKTPMVLFIVLSLSALHRQRWLAAGVLIALSALTLQTAAFVVAPAALVMLVAARRRLRALLLLLAGGLLPTLAAVVYFTAVGALRDFVEAFVVLPVRYATPDPLLSQPAEHWSSMEIGYGISLWVLLGGLVAMLGLAAVRLCARAARRPPHSSATTTALAVALLCGVGLMLRDFDSWADAFSLLPIAALGVGGVARVVADRLPRPAAQALLSAWLVATLLTAVGYAVGNRDDGLARQRASVAAVLRHMPAGASMLSVQAPTPLVLAGRTNPTRYQMFSSGLDDYMRDRYPGGLAGYLRTVRREQPDLITVGTELQRATKVDPKVAWLSGAWQPQYRRIGRGPGWTWYARRSLGHVWLTAAHRAVHQAASAG